MGWKAGYLEKYSTGTTLSPYNIGDILPMRNGYVVTCEPLDAGLKDDDAPCALFGNFERAKRQNVIVVPNIGSTRSLLETSTR